MPVRHYAYLRVYVLQALCLHEFPHLPAKKIARYYSAGIRATFQVGRYGGTYPDCKRPIEKHLPDESFELVGPK